MCLLGDKPFWDEFYELRQGLALELPTRVGVGSRGYELRSRGWPWNQGDELSLALSKPIRKERLSHQAGGRTMDLGLERRKVEAIVSHSQDKLKISRG